MWQTQRREAIGTLAGGIAHDFNDLVFTDMTMPGMTGDRFATELMKTRPDVPVIVSSGFTERMDEAQTEAMGIRAFAVKPLMMRELAFIVRKVLDG